MCGNNQWSNKLIGVVRTGDRYYYYRVAFVCKINLHTK